MIDLDKLDLPDELQIRPTYLPELMHFGVFCKKTVITKSTRFGPYPGKPINPSDAAATTAATAAKSSSSSLSAGDLDNNHMWEIFNDGRLSHFVDGKSPSLTATNIINSKATTSNNSNLNSSSSSSSSSTAVAAATSPYANQWMIYVNCARFAQEQNLIAVQCDGEIYYEVCKDIAQVS